MSEAKYTAADLNTAAQFAGTLIYQLVMEQLAKGLASADNASSAILMPGEDVNRNVRVEAVRSTLRGLILAFGVLDPKEFDWTPEVVDAVAATKTGENAVP